MVRFASNCGDESASYSHFSKWMFHIDVMEHSHIAACLGKYSIAKDLIREIRIAGNQNTGLLQKLSDDHFVVSKKDCRSHLSGPTGIGPEALKP